MQRLVAILSTFLLLITLTLCRPRVVCDARTLPPMAPSPKACSRFLARLSKLARKEPKGAYKWYGRHLDDCSECVKLPAYIYFPRLSCATVIDVSDQDDDSLSIFGMGDLERALSAMFKQCWLGGGDDANRRNGVGYPESQAARVGFVNALTGGIVEGIEGMKRGNRTLAMVDLSKGWIEKVDPSGQLGGLALQEGRTHETA